MTKYAPYGWLIIRDNITDGVMPAPCNDNAKGMTGPRNIHPAIQIRLEGAAVQGKRRAAWSAPDVEFFRMYDDDGELYYTGCYLTISDTETDGFEPLDDFGTPNAGAVRIDYFYGWLEGSEIWRTL